MTKTISRRDFLKLGAAGMGALALGQILPPQVAQAARAAGHINADTPLGLWSDGLNILSRYTGNFNAQAVA